MSRFTFAVHTTWTDVSCHTRPERSHPVFHRPDKEKNSLLWYWRELKSLSCSADVWTQWLQRSWKKCGQICVGFVDKWILSPKQEKKSHETKYHPTIYKYSPWPRSEMWLYNSHQIPALLLQDQHNVSQCNVCWKSSRCDPIQMQANQSLLVFFNISLYNLAGHLDYDIGFWNELFLEIQTKPWHKMLTTNCFNYLMDRLEQCSD